LGTGLAPGINYADATTAAERAAWIGAYVAGIKSADPGLWCTLTQPATVTGPDIEAARKTQVARALRGLLAAIEKAPVEEKSATQKFIYAKNAEDIDFSEDFTCTDLENNNKRCGLLYGRRFHSQFVPKLAVMKRLVFSVVVDLALPSTTRISLASLRVTPDDGPLLLLRRYFTGLCLVCAEQGVFAECRDEGYGEVTAASYRLWLSWYDCAELLDTVEAYTAGLADITVTSIVESIINMIAASSGAGRVRLSGSAAVAHATIHAIPIIAAARAATAQAAVKRAVPDESSDGESSDDDEVGPNGLVRMKGGNPAGSRCRDHAKGACPRKMCSFSHKKAKKKKAKATPAQGAAAE
jgi:hypothetical protein